MDKSHTAETPDEDPREESAPSEGEPRTATSREIADDYVQEHFGVSLAELEERYGDRATTTEPWGDCTTERVAAIEPNEVTAGVHVRRVDVDEAFEDMPFMIELEQWFPAEDDRVGDVVALHGEHAALKLIAALASVTSSRFDEVPWDVE